MRTDNTTLSADVFEAVVTAFAEALVSHYRERYRRLEHQAALTPPAPFASPLSTEPSPWLRVAGAAKRAQCGRSTIYSEVQAGRLRAARVGGGRILRIRAGWLTLGFKAEAANPLIKRSAPVGRVGSAATRWNGGRSADRAPNSRPRDSTKTFRPTDGLSGHQVLVHRSISRTSESLGRVTGLLRRGSCRVTATIHTGAPVPDLCVSRDARA